MSQELRPLAAIVLAAGASTRMGRQKLLLPWGKTTVLGCTLENLRQSGVTPLILVVGHQWQTVLAAVDTGGFQVAVNDDYLQGQSTSVRRGIGLLPAGYGAMFVLGDQPLVSSPLYRQLAQAYRESDAPVVLPVDFQGKRGNPVVFAPELIAQMTDLRGDQGARSLIQRYQKDILTVTTAERGIFLDLDTPQAYQDCLKEAEEDADID